MKIDLSPGEARATLDALVFLSAYTRREMADHLGWNGSQINAWGRALRKVDDALTTAKVGER